MTLARASTALVWTIWLLILLLELATPPGDEKEAVEDVIVFETRSQDERDDWVAAISQHLEFTARQQQSQQPRSPFASSPAAAADSTAM